MAALDGVPSVPPPPQAARQSAAANAMNKSAGAAKANRSCVTLIKNIAHSNRIAARKPTTIDAGGDNQRRCANGATRELAAVVTDTANCDGTVTLAGTLHAVAAGKFAHVTETLPRYPVAEFTTSV